MRKRLRGLLEKIYILLICLLFLLIVMTPYVITESLKVGENLLITQQVLQSSLIAAIIIFGYVILFLYRRDIRRRAKEVEALRNDKLTLEDRMEDAFRYIGTVNVQLEAIRSAFAGLKEYRDHGGDFKGSLKFLTTKILAMIRGNYVLVRLVDPEGFKTLSEYVSVREGQEAEQGEVSNKLLVSGGEFPDLLVIASSQEYSEIRVYCVFPRDQVTREQSSMIQSLLNELVVLYLIFSSSHYRGGNGEK